MKFLECKVSNAKSLLDCCLDFCLGSCWNINKDEAITMFMSLLQDAAYVKDVVTIGEWGLQAVSLVEGNRLPCPMSKSKVKCLKLDTDPRAADMAEIVCVLRGLNCLEKLIVTNNDCHRPCPPWFSRHDQLCDEDKSYLTSEDFTIGLDLNIKAVEIRGFGAKPDWFSVNDKHVIPLLVELSLKFASVLENVNISGDRSKYDVVELTRKVLSYPRSSPAAVITILE